MHKTAEGLNETTTTKIEKTDTTKATETKQKGRKKGDVKLPVFPPFDFPANFTCDNDDCKEIEALVARRECEKYDRGDSNTIRGLKDKEYISRLQYIIASAKRMIAQTGSPKAKYLLNRATDEVYKYVCYACKAVLKDFDDFTVTRLAQNFALAICGGKFKGGSVTAYLKALKREVDRERFDTEHGFDSETSKAVRALHKYEECVAKTVGRSPEEITEEERYDQLIKGRVSRKTAEAFKNRTFDSFKAKSLNLKSDDDTTDGEPVEKIDTIVYDDRQCEAEFYEDGTLFDQFNALEIAKHPMKNLILKELIKEGWSEKDIFEMGIYLMGIGFRLEAIKENLDITVTEYMRKHYELVSLLYERVCGEKISKSRLKSAVQQALGIKEDTERMRAIKEVIVLLFPDEAGSYIRSGLKRAAFA